LEKFGMDAGKMMRPVDRSASVSLGSVLWMCMSLPVIRSGLVSVLEAALFGHVHLDEPAFVNGKLDGSEPNFCQSLTENLERISIWTGVGARFLTWRVDLHFVLLGLFDLRFNIH
jgi:hypothetical protein